MEYPVLVLVHVALAIFWGGGILIAGFFLVPSILDAGPAGGAVMAGMVKRRFPQIMVIAGALTLLSGGRLYWLHFSPEWLKTGEGMALSLGGLLAISAFAI